jgi:hypothetical protein
MRLLKPSFHQAMPCFTEPEHFSDNFSKLLLDQTFNVSEQQNIHFSNDCSLTDFYVADLIFTTGTMGELTPVYVNIVNKYICIEFYFL